MKRKLLVCTFALLFVAGFTVAADKGDEKTWTGWVTDTHCGAKNAEGGNHGGCAKKCVEGSGAKFALYDPTSKKIYVLDPQDKATPHAGNHVKVKGTAEGDTIKVASIEPTGEQKGHEKEKEKSKDKPKEKTKS
jgi:hypothetical protein